MVLIKHMDKFTIIFTQLKWTDLNHLTPNDHYNGRTSPLTSEISFYIFIQQM